MQIKIDLKILIFLLIFHLTGQIKIYILLMIFACLHELGHLGFGLILGFRPITFEMKPIGFSVSFYNLIKDYNKKILNGNLLELKKIFVYFAGPMVNIIISFIIYYIKMDFLLKQELIYINLIIAFVNLLPIYPLDGGRIVKSLICILCGLKESYKFTERISWVTTIFVLASSSILVLKVQNFGLLVIVIYLLYIRIIESSTLESKLKLYDMLESERDFGGTFQNH